MKPIITAVLALLLLSGCYTARKGEKQFQKFSHKHRKEAAIATRTEFPCTNGKPDSAQFKNSLTDIMNSLNRVQEDLKRPVTVVAPQQKLPERTPDNAQLLDLVAQLNDQHEEDVANYNDLKWKLIDALKDLKPVVIPVEDSAKIYEALEKAREAQTLADTYKGKYQVEADWHQERARKDAGNFIVRIPYLWGVLLLLLFAAAVGYSIKKKLNPISLLKTK